jgi:hypothetical protein
VLPGWKHRRIGLGIAPPIAACKHRIGGASGAAGATVLAAIDSDLAQTDQRAAMRRPIKLDSAIMINGVNAPRALSYMREIGRRRWPTNSAGHAPLAAGPADRHLR